MLKIFSRTRNGIFNYTGEFARHLMFEKGAFLLVIVLILGAALVFMKGLEVCQKAIDRYNDSLVNFYKSIDPSELKGTSSR